MKQVIEGFLFWISAEYKLKFTLKPVWCPRGRLGETIRNTVKSKDFFELHVLTQKHNYFVIIFLDHLFKVDQAPIIKLKVAKNISPWGVS